MRGLKAFLIFFWALFSLNVSADECSFALLGIPKNRYMILESILKDGNQNGEVFYIEKKLQTLNEAKWLYNRTDSFLFKMNLTEKILGLSKNPNQHLTELAQKAIELEIKQRKAGKESEMGNTRPLLALIEHGDVSHLSLLVKVRESFGVLTHHLADWGTEYISARAEGNRPRRNREVYEKSEIISRLTQDIETGTTQQFELSVKIYANYLVREDIEYLIHFCLNANRFDLAFFLYATRSLSRPQIDETDANLMLQTLREKLNWTSMELQMGQGLPMKMDTSTMDSQFLSEAELRAFEEFGDAYDAASLDAIQEPIRNYIGRLQRQDSSETEIRLLHFNYSYADAAKAAAQKIRQRLNRERLP